MMRNRHSSVAGPRGQTRARRPSAAPAWATAFGALGVHARPRWRCCSPPAPARPAGAGRADSMRRRDRTSCPPSRQPFRPGESLHFSVQYGPIHAGSAWLEVHGPGARRCRLGRDAGGARRIQLVLQPHLQGAEPIESSWDVRDRRSLRYREDRHEGGFKAQSEIVLRSGTGTRRIYRTARCFRFRPAFRTRSRRSTTRALRRSRSAAAWCSTIMPAGEASRSRCACIGRERVTRPAGTFDCVVVEPVLHAGGIFKNNGRLLIWLT